MEEVLNRLIDLVQKAAPELWRIAQTRITANLVESIVFFVLCGALTASGIYAVKRGISYYRSDYDNEIPGMVISVLAGMTTVFAIGFMIQNLSTIINLLISRDYYVLLSLTQLVK